jgi:hypothetical protein
MEKSIKEIINLKLKSLGSKWLKEFAKLLSVKDNNLNSDKLIKNILSVDDLIYINKKLNQFINDKFNKILKERESQISTSVLIKELNKINRIKWGIVQGELDRKIQTEYVRKFFEYDKLKEKVLNELSKELLDYVCASWYNYWTTLIIEEHIAKHPNVLSTLKKIKGIDVFIKDYPFDLKVTYLPKNYDPQDAINNPKKLLVWLYENQGAQRFGSDPRFYVVLFDSKNPDQSWKLKRDFKFIFNKIDNFLNNFNLLDKDEIIFTFKRETHTTVAKILLIFK